MKNKRKVSADRATNRINHPDYYMLPNGIECIDVSQFFNFLVGNAFKYLWRAGRKTEQGMDDRDKEIEDLKKAIFYINQHIKLLEDGKQ